MAGRSLWLEDALERAEDAPSLEGEERAHWYEQGIEIYPGWVQYRKRAPRQIPVIELQAESSTASGD